MKTIAPKIDKRSFQRLLKQMQSMVPFYTPEWNPDIENEQGQALMKIYLHMLEQVISRLNQVPEKNFVAFLNMLGIKLRPAQSAKAVLTFSLAEGALEHVTVPEGTLLTGEGTDGEEVTFKTQSDLRVTPSLLKEIVSIDAAKDQIFVHTDNYIKNEKFHILTGKNKQERSLYIAHTDLFSLTNPTQIGVEFSLKNGATGGVLKIAWEYWDGERWIEIANFVAGETANNPDDTTALLNKSGTMFVNKANTGEIAINELYKMESRWLRCRLKNSLSANNTVLLPEIDTIQLRVNSSEPFSAELAFNNDIPINLEERTFQLEVIEHQVKLAFFVDKKPSPKKDDQEIFLLFNIDTIEEGDFLKLSNGKGLAEIRQITKIEPNNKKKVTLNKTLTYSYNEPFNIEIKNLKDETKKIELFFNDLEKPLPSKGDKVVYLKYSNDDVAKDDILKISIGEDSLFETKRVTAINGDIVTLNESLGLDYEQRSVELVTAIRGHEIVKLTLVESDFPKKGGETVTVKNSVDKLQVDDFIQLINKKNLSETRKIKSISQDDNKLTLYKKLEFDYDKSSTVKLVFSVSVNVNVKAVEPFDLNNKAVVLGRWKNDQKEIAVLKFVPIAQDDAALLTSLTINRIGDLISNYYSAGEIINITPVIKPFGELPGLFDTFYIASDEAFSKKGADIELIIDAQWMDSESIEYSPSAVLSWEYWNGKSWRALLINDATDRFSKPGKLTFTCPEDIVQTEVNGEEKYWIRVRIIDGDYGREIIIVPTENEGTDVDIKTGTIHYPFINELKISYKGKPAQPQHCFSINNLDFEDHIIELVDPKKSFTPFKKLPEQFQGLFLGFDKQIVGGPIRVLFNLTEQILTETDNLKIQWFFWKGDHWSKINSLDGTENLTRKDLLEFSIPIGFESRKLFDKQNFWIKGNVIEGDFKQLDSNEEGLKVPELIAIYPNSTYAIQASFVNDEVIGASDLTANQAFQLFNPLIISQTLLIDEPVIPSGDEEKLIIQEEGDDAIQPITDQNGEILHYQIRWHEVEDFYHSGEKSRHYIVDKRQGIIQFGDGINGLVPPLGRDNIKASYRYGGGINGNVDVGKITGLKNAIPFVNEVTNHLPADGGSDTETLEEVLERGPKRLKNRDRAVTCDDYAALARNASRKIKRSKCLPNTNADGDFVMGEVSVVIVPDTQKRDETVSRLLVKTVQAFLEKYSTNLVSAPQNIHVRGAHYIEITIEPTVAPVSLEASARVDTGIIDILNRYIHPLTGGTQAKGWEFGKSICRSEIFALLEGVKGVDYVQELVFLVDGKKQSGDVAFENDMLPFSGEHKVNLAFDLKDNNARSNPPDYTFQDQINEFCSEEQS